MNAYELARLKTEYESMREYLVKIINILSKSSTLDNLSKAQNCLNNNYLVDDNVCKYNEISDLKAEIKNELSRLKVILRELEKTMSELEKTMQGSKEQ